MMEVRQIIVALLFLLYNFVSTIFKELFPLLPTPII